jgi:excisionase family DNA binding protein
MDTTDKLEQVYTVLDVAKALKVRPQTVYAMIKDGRLRAGKVGRVFRIKSADVQAALSGRGNVKKTAER